MKQIAFILLVLFTLSARAYAQDHSFERPISYTDSIRLKAFIDSLDNSPMFSLRYQRFYDSALTIKPWKAGWWQQKAMLAMKMKKYDLGMSYLDSAVKYDNSHHHYLEYRAFMKCIFQRSYREAIKDFDLMLSYYGDLSVMDHTYNFYKGLCYLQLNQPDSCEYYINLSMDIRRKASGANSLHYLDWFYLGIARYEKEDYVTAVTYFDSSLAFYKQFADAWYYKGICQVRLKQADKALESITLANTNIQQGYTINEDNAIHEQYPYQVKKTQLDGALEYLQKQQVKKE